MMVQHYQTCGMRTGFDVEWVQPELVPRLCHSAECCSADALRMRSDNAKWHSKQVLDWWAISLRTAWMLGALLRYTR